MSFESRLDKALKDNHVSDIARTKERWLQSIEAKVPKPINKHLEAVEPAVSTQLIVVDGIKASLLCPHHLYGVELDILVAYVPGHKQLGLSKFARICKDMTGIITQEAYTERVADAIHDGLEAKFVGIRVKAVHGCMRVRGIEAHESRTDTMAYRALGTDYLEDFKKMCAIYSH